MYKLINPYFLIFEIFAKMRGSELEAIGQYTESSAKGNETSGETKKECHWRKKKYQKWLGQERGEIYPWNFNLKRWEKGPNLLESWSAEYKEEAICGGNCRMKSSRSEYNIGTLPILSNNNDPTDKYPRSSKPISQRCRTSEPILVHRGWGATGVFSWKKPSFLFDLSEPGYPVL